ncbi:hypothetical protein MIND_00389100 [Mycena indigotica]|uniref:Uncharacterized protein n=1 Tax=Mycena indigotica TaxID=2126181 RepID=A0A8H6W9X6_9AGAR|nr:uncharacterized protein MIND_00389100 [Mycena indigotica]KAF7310157.1 hypothetical protein MIND_00389100 [Mycena indigotica]
MPPGRSAAAPERETGALLVSVMKENADLKTALDTKARDVLAAETALLMLVAENQALEKAGKAAENEVDMARRHVQGVTKRLDDAENEVRRLRAVLRERDDDVARLERENEIFREANAHLSGHREQRERDRDNKQASPMRPRISEECAPTESSDRTGHSKMRGWSLGEHSHTADPPPSYSSAPYQASRTWVSAAGKPPTVRQVANQYMHSLALPSNLRQDKFAKGNAIGQLEGGPYHLDVSRHSGSLRPTLFLPGRLLWCGPRGGHALAFAPTHEYVNGSWRPHTQLTSLALSTVEVDLLSHRDDLLYYAGVYRVLSLRAVPGCAPGGDIPDVEISHPSVFRAMRLRQAAPADQLKLQQNPAFAATDGRPTVECFGLQLVRYDDGARDALAARFGTAVRVLNTAKAMAQAQLQVPLGPKRKWDPEFEQEANLPGKKRAWAASSY